MALEVRELLIKASIMQEGSAGATASTSAETSSSNSPSGNEQIISACIEKILEIIKEKHER
jgi:hypothetical protein